MKERPILFNAPMVRAILAGAKTQTRRVVKDRHIDAAPPACFFQWLCENCPYGQPGDRLWVRETCRADERPDGLDGVRYLADDHFDPIKNTEDAADQWVAMHHYRGGNGGGLIGPTVPAIHMPRWASRITLEIPSVRAERLQDISEVDAVAEGIRISSQARRSDACYGIYECLMPDGKTHFSDSAYELYRKLWEQINGPGSWDANPWVWVVEFKHLKGGAA